MGRRTKAEPRSPAAAGSRRPRRSRQRLTRTDRGSVVVEAVLVVPLAMVILLVAIQFALWAHAAQVAQLAASEGDRVARSAHGGLAAGTIEADSVLNGAGSDVASGSAVVTLLPGGQTRVIVHGRALGVFSWPPLPVSAQLVGPVQEFRSSE